MWKLETEASHAATSRGMPRAPRVRKSHRRISPRAFGGSTALTSPWFWTSDPQNNEAIPSCCYKSPSPWSFVTAALSQIQHPDKDGADRNFQITLSNSSWNSFGILNKTAFTWKWILEVLGEFGVVIHIMLYLKWITNKDLLYSTGPSARYSMAAWMGGEFGGQWIHVYVCLSPFTVHLKLSQHC